MNRTLKYVRTEAGLSQAEVAKVIGVNVSNYSNIETGSVQIALEDCILLERSFSEHISWQDSIEPEQKALIIEGLITLFSNYPITTVINFAQRAIKEGARLGRPELLIQYYARASQELDVEPLLPPMFTKPKTK